MKKTLPMLLLLLANFNVSAVTPQIDFNVEAVVPDQNFYVTAVNGWDTKTQKMAWNESNWSLSPVVQQLKMKNANGGIKAYLNGQPSLSSASGTDTFDLAIDVAGKTLPTDAANAVTLYEAGAAGVEKTATVEIKHDGNGIKPPMRPAAGTYMGSVTMIFDTIAP